MRLVFYGATREVTGSNILVETLGRKILLDCGLFQGFKMAEERNYAPFLYDPKTIDFLVLCHAHLDHTGRIPKLVKDGFGGSIFSTSPTKELAQIVLEDSAKLMRQESERDNHKLLYDERDIERAMKQFVVTPYREAIEIAPGIKLTLLNAGHILGSAIAVVEAEGKKLAYTSDLGNSPSQLLDPPAIVDSADYAIVETTYGGRVHEEASLRQKKLNEIINGTVSAGGVLMIPTFAIERTQELLHDIEHFCETGNCEIPSFYLDSPLAEKATAVFQKYPEFLGKKINSLHGKGDFFGVKRVKMTTSVDESKQIKDAPNPKIIIAGSGMMNGGRIIFHLMEYIGDPKNTLLIVGYQAYGTLGRRLFEGEKEVKLFGKKYTVKARVRAIGSYSAHADGPQLENWVSKISGLKRVFLVHGEHDESVAFSKRIRQNLNVEPLIPQYGEEYVL